MMNLNFRKMTGLAVASSFLWMTSCRTADKDNNLMDGGPATVKINFKGDAFDEETPDLKTAARSMNVQKTSVLVDPSTYVEIEVVPDHTPKTRATRAALDQSVMRIIAYEAGTQKFRAYKDYFVMGGQAIPFAPNGSEPLALDGGVKYTIVAYSFGSTANLPEPPKNGDLFFQAKVAYDYSKYSSDKYKGSDFMYFKQENFTPVGGSNTLDILLKHKVAQLTAKLNIPSGQIQEVKNVSITPNDKLGDFSLMTDNFSNLNTPVGVIAGLKFNGTNTANAVSEPIMVNADTDGNKTGVFGATVNIDGTEKNIETKPFFNITRGTRKNININFNVTSGKCMVKISATELREFMCHNVGADISADAFTGSAAIQGAKYKYGAATGEIGHYISQAVDQKYLNKPDSQSDYPWLLKSLAVAGWDGSSIGGSKNPCPVGYRVPTDGEWGAVLKFNKKVFQGEGPISDPTQTTYSGGTLFTDPDNPKNKMFLPAAGFRSGEYGNSQARSRDGNYWSVNSSGTSTAYYLHLFIDSPGNQAGITQNGYKYHGFSVRCIKSN